MPSNKASKEEIADRLKRYRRLYRCRPGGTPEVGRQDVSGTASETLALKGPGRQPEPRRWNRKERIETQRMEHAFSSPSGLSILLYINFTRFFGEVHTAHQGLPVPEGDEHE